MNENLTTVVSGLRMYIKALRTALRNDTFGRGRHELRKDYARQERVQQVQARLGYLVPLYRALHGAAQQSGAETSRGARLYLQKFDALGSIIRRALSHDHHVRREKFFGDVVETLQVPVPTAGVPAEKWPTATIGQLLEQGAQAVEADRLLKLSESRNAAAARNAFLASLTAEQRTLLTVALVAAKVRGVHSITLDHRDLVAK